MIVLIGFMGAGKTSVGALVASKLGLPFLDTDASVATLAGRSIAEIFERDGEGAFRALEREVVRDALSGPDAVVALGGGSLGDPALSSLLDRATVVHLDVSFTEAMGRVGGDAARPMLQQDPEALFAARDAVYRKHAEVSVMTDGRPPEEIADEIVRVVAETSGSAP